MINLIYCALMRLGFTPNTHPPYSDHGGLMELEFNNGKVMIWTRSANKGIYAISVKNPRIAYQINQVLEHYPKYTTFALNEEPTFVFTTAQIESIANTSRVIRKILAQLLPGIVKAA